MHVFIFLKYNSLLPQQAEEHRVVKTMRLLAVSDLLVREGFGIYRLAGKTTLTTIYWKSNKINISKSVIIHKIISINAVLCIYICISIVNKNKIP